MVEVIDLLSSPELPSPGSKVVARPPKTTAPLAKALDYEPPKDDWFTLSSDDPPLPPLPPIPSPTTSKSNTSLGAFTKTTSNPKRGNDFFFLSNDFDTTVNLSDPFDLPVPAAKKRCVSSSPQPVPSKTAIPKAAGNKRSVPNIESSTKTSGARTTNAPALKGINKAKTNLDFDPIIFTSSPDPFADAARRKKGKEMMKEIWEEDEDEEDDFGLGYRTTKAGKTSTRGVLGSHGNKRDGPKFDESSDFDLPDLDAIPAKALSKSSSKSSSSAALAKYNADKALEKKAQEKAREKADKDKVKTKKAYDKEGAKLAEQEQKRLAKEEKAREKEKAAGLARVNTLRTDKKVSTPEMIVDLSSSLDEKLAGQVRSFLGPLQVQCTEWESEIKMVKWRRKVEAVYNEESGIFEPCAKHIKSERHVMVVVSAKEFVELATGGEGSDLDAHFLRMKSKHGECEIIYLIEGLTAWMRKNRNLKNRQFEQAVRSHIPSQELPTASQRRKKKEQEYVDEELVEDALLRLQVQHGALIHHTAVMVETSEWVVAFTQHISTIPYR